MRLGTTIRARRWTPVGVTFISNKDNVCPSVCRRPRDDDETASAPSSLVAEQSSPSMFADVLGAPDVNPHPAVQFLRKRPRRSPYILMPPLRSEDIGRVRLL